VKKRRPTDFRHFCFDVPKNYNTRRRSNHQPRPPDGGGPAMDGVERVEPSRGGALALVATLAAGARRVFFFFFFFATIIIGGGGGGGRVDGGGGAGV